MMNSHINEIVILHATHVKACRSGIDIPIQDACDDDRIRMSEINTISFALLVSEIMFKILPSLAKLISAFDLASCRRHFFAAREVKVYQNLLHFD